MEVRFCTIAVEGGRVCVSRNVGDTVQEGALARRAKAGGEGDVLLNSVCVEIGLQVG